MELPFTFIDDDGKLWMDISEGLKNAEQLEALIRFLHNVQAEMKKPALRLEWNMDRRDYYAGTFCTLYEGDKILWAGYSDDKAESILKSVGIDLKIVRIPKDWDD